MYISETIIRVRYGETDKMGFVYYGNYAEYIEVARTEALRYLGLTYREIEEQGVILPVLSLNIKYIKPAFYDDELRIKTIIEELPAIRMKFNYEIYKDKGELINKSSTEHVFVSLLTGKPCEAPKLLLTKLAEYFKV